MKRCESCEECVYVGEYEYLCMTIQEIIKIGKIFICKKFALNFG